jgi:replicative DNA helicase
VGKTAFSLQIAESLNGLRALYVSIESRAEMLVARRVCGLAGIEQKQLRAGNLTAEQREMLKSLISDYMAKNSNRLYFDDKSTTLGAVERSIATVRPDLIIVDHLGEIATSGDNKTLGLLENFEHLKQIAKRHNAAQIIIHTINADDATAKAEDEQPSFTSLGWAKDLRYKTDIFLGLYASKQTLDIPNLERRLLWVMKDREGSRYARINLRFDMLRQWFSDAQ